MVKVFRSAEGASFVDLESFGKLEFDVRYAREDNFLGRAVYSEPRAFLQREVAEALMRAAELVARDGAGILIYDAYRPWSVTKAFWDESSPESRHYLANPDLGSVHNRGCAIDCGLFDLRTRRPLPMPSDFDEFSERAWSEYAGGTEEETRNRKRLRTAMLEAGFHGIRHEWWHFNHPAAAHHPVYDVTFAELRKLTR